MKKIPLSILIFLISISGRAQVLTNSNGITLTPATFVTANLTAQSASCATTNACLTIHLPNNAVSASVTLAGTFTATGQIEESGDNQLTWPTNVGSPAAPGLTSFALNGITDIRLRLSSYASGAVVATINVTLNTGPIGPPGPGIPIGTTVSGSDITFPANVKTNGAQGLLTSVNADYYGHQFPQSWQAKNAELRYGNISSLKVALIGDSELRNAAISDGLATYLEWTLGNAGSGWINAAAATVTWNGMVSTTLGTWVDSALTVNTWGPSISETNSSDIATPASKTFTGNMTSANILYKIQPGGGSFTWAVDGGGTTTISTAGTLGLGTTNIPGLTLASHAITLTVTVAGTAGVTLFGADTFLTTRGVQINDISATGSTTTTWTQQNLTLWKSTITSINPDLTFISLGTNDSNQSISVATYTANLTTLVQALQAVNPLMDIVLFSAQDNGVWTTISPAMYNAAMATLARTLGVGYIDAYDSVGLYASANTRGLMANTTHLNQYGGQVYIDRILEFIMPPITPAFVPSSRNNTFLGGGGNLSMIGQFNSAASQLSLNVATTGGYNTCYGYGSCGAVTVDNYNTGIGAQSLANAASDGNTAVGQGSGITQTSGGHITAIGQNSCGTSLTDSYITCLGVGADVLAATGITDASAIGSSAIAPASHTVSIGSSSVTDVYLGGSTAPAKEHASLFISTVPTGTAPVTVTSTTPVANLQLSSLSRVSTTVTIGSGADIAATSLCSTALCGAGTYRVNVYINMTTPCGTTGTFIAWLGYTDDSGARAGSSGTTFFDISGTGAVPSTGTLTTTSTSNWGQATYILRTTGAATGGLGSINYGATRTACGTAGPMVGKMYLTVEQIQ